MVSSVGRVCNFLGSVSPQQRFEIADRCYSSVKAQSFIWQTKDNMPFRREGGPTPKKRPQSISASSFYTFLSPPSQACPMQTGLARKAVCFTRGSYSSPWIFFCSIFMGFSLSLSFSHCHFGLHFYLSILTT